MSAFGAKRIFYLARIGFIALRVRADKALIAV
jgi:hypothetical protein